MSHVLETQSAAISVQRLVSTAWVAEHLNDPQIILVESNEDPLLYPSGHIPGAHEVDWTRDLNDPLRRDYLDRERFQALMQKLGATDDSLIVFYGDRSNWWAAYALWVFELFGHTRSCLMDGGRLLWAKEGRPMTTKVPQATPSQCVAKPRNDEAIRIFREDVLRRVDAGAKFIDVRSPQEFSGEKLHMEGYPNEGALRGGHIPGAKSIPWATATDPETGTFRATEELQAIYKDFQPDEDVVVYCRIGERSSHTWFALKYLLGYQNVRNYDGSWTEYGNLVGAPIEQGS